MSERRRHEERGDKRGKHESETHSPVMINAGQPPPRDGEQSCGLTYDARLHMWVYVAAYSFSDVALVKQCARTLQERLRIPFVSITIGDPVKRSGRGSGARADSPQRYIPGLYAATYADPRGGAQTLQEPASG